MTSGYGDWTGLPDDRVGVLKSGDGVLRREESLRRVVTAGVGLAPDPIVAGLRDIDARLQALRDQLAPLAIAMAAPAARRATVQAAQSDVRLAPVTSLAAPGPPLHLEGAPGPASPVLTAISRLRTDSPGPPPAFPVTSPPPVPVPVPVAAQLQPRESVTGVVVAESPAAVPSAAQTDAPVPVALSEALAEPPTTEVETQALAGLAPSAEVRPRSHTRGGWIGGAIRELASTDPETAGRAIIGLLPIQGDVITEVVSYDLVISGGQCYSVTVTDEETSVRRVGHPRPLDSVDGRIASTVAGIGAVSAMGRFRGRGRSGSMRLEGRRRRRALAAFREVISARVSLAQARAAGVELDGEVLLALVAAGLHPQWTIGHRFTIEFVTQSSGQAAKRLYLRVNDGHLLSMSSGLPLDVPAATVTCRADELISVVTGDGTVSDAALAGKRAPMMLLQGWMARLESGRG